MSVAPAPASAPRAGRLRPRLIAALSGTAGLALYSTRASLDLHPGPRGAARLAMLPSWPELAGLIVLSGLVTSSAVMWLERRRTTADPRTSTRTDRSAADALLPLFALGLLTLPYLPWIPDAVPILRLFAGPARFLLWFVVLGQTALAARDAIRKPRTIAPRTASTLIFAASVVAFGAGAGRLAGSAIYPGGDEPHYLIITQSLVRDRDLRIENNHQREDYAEYFGSPLEPHYRTRGVDGQIYSIHPVGLPFLAAPAFAAAGYKGVVAMLVLIAALAATLMWRWTAGVTGSPEAATFAWAAVALGAPYFFNAFAVYPEIPAALCVMLALADKDVGDARTPGSEHAAGRLVRGLAIGALPWLSTKYAPMAVALAAILAWRVRTNRASIAATLAPFIASAIAWLGFFYWIWGSPLPSAPYGPDPQTTPATLLSGAPGLLIDQEYGVFFHAPALMLSIAGWIAMWRAGGLARRTAVESIAAFGALLGTVGAFELWWGGSGIAGRPLVSGLPLLAPAIGWAYESARASAPRRAAHQLLLLAGLAIAGTLLIAQNGLLLAEGRDGVSELLRWLAPDLPVAALAPSFIMDSAIAAAAHAVPWIAAIALVPAVCRRVAVREPGRAALTVSLLASGVVLVLCATLPAVARTRFHADPPDARGRIDLLDAYDAVARPYAITFDPLQRIDVHAVPPLFTMVARPGSRHQPQPLAVLLNARFSLPAGEYGVDLRPRPGMALAGELGLQLGRLGRPVTEWAVAADPGGTWRQRFTLHVDTSFVGFVASEALDPRVGEIVIRPSTIVDRGARVAAPTVLAASGYGSTVVYFHDEHVYAEDGGFWVAGRSTMHATAATAGPDQPLTLRVHGGPQPSTVSIETPVWRREVPLTPNQPADVVVPPAARGRLIPLRITTYNGFVPARESPGNRDERLLGCWVEIRGS